MSRFRDMVIIAVGTGIIISFSILLWYGQIRNVYSELEDMRKNLRYINKIKWFVAKHYHDGQYGKVLFRK